jgi:hypothetical protein
MTDFFLWFDQLENNAMLLIFLIGLSLSDIGGRHG